MPANGDEIANWLPRTLTATVVTSTTAVSPTTSTVAATSTAPPPTSITSTTAPLDPRNVVAAERWDEVCVATIRDYLDLVTYLVETYEHLPPEIFLVEVNTDEYFFEAVEELEDRVEELECGRTTAYLVFRQPRRGASRIPVRSVHQVGLQRPLHRKGARGGVRSSH